MRILNREELLIARNFKVARITLQNDEGKEFKREVIEHPGAACIIPMLDDDTVLMVEQ